MNIKDLYEMPPWDWPGDSGGMFKESLDDRAADPLERFMAAEMAGDFVVINDALAESLLAVAGKNDETQELRAKAALALGPALEHADIYEFDDPEDIVVSKEIFRKIQAVFRKIYHDAGVPKEVRRRTLEAAVRSPQDWHAAAVRAAFAGDDEDWQLTAVFCMRFIRGFDRQILEALESGNPDIKYEAVLAAGNWGIKEAWPHVADLLDSKDGDESLLLAAIEAAAGFDLHEAVEPLEKLLDSDDDDIIDAVHEALAMLGAGLFEDEFEEGDDW